MNNWFFLILGLVLAYLLEFTRPWVKSFLKRNTTSFRSKNIKSIKDEYKRIKEYKENQATLAIESIRLMAKH